MKRRNLIDDTAHRKVTPEYEERDWFLDSGLDKDTLEREYKGFSSKLRLDVHDLDQAIIEQPEYFHKVATITAALLDIRDSHKEILVEGDSIIAKELKLAYDRRVEKYTNQSIQYEVTADRRHKKAAEALNYLKGQVNKWFALKEAYEQRARMLSHLVKLWIANYYSDSAVAVKEESERVGSSRVRRRR